MWPQLADIEFSTLPTHAHMLTHTTSSLWQYTLTQINPQTHMFEICSSVKVLLSHLQGFGVGFPAQHLYIYVLYIVHDCFFSHHGQAYWCCMFSVIIWLQTTLTVMQLLTLTWIYIFSSVTLWITISSFLFLLLLWFSWFWFQLHIILNILIEK